MVHQTGQGGGFAAPRRAGDQHQAVGIIGKGHYIVWDAQGVPVGQVEGHYPDDQGQGAPLP